MSDSSCISFVNPVQKLEDHANSQNTFFLFVFLQSDPIRIHQRFGLQPAFHQCATPLGRHSAKIGACVNFVTLKESPLYCEAAS